MSRKWRNLLIGVLVAAVIIAGLWLLNRGDNDFSAEYSDTYDAYVKVHADDASADEIAEMLAALIGAGGVGELLEKVLSDDFLDDGRRGTGKDPAWWWA